MMHIENYIENIKMKLPEIGSLQAWEIIDNLESVLLQKMKTLSDEYKIENNVAIHKTATIEQGVILKEQLLFPKIVMLVQMLI